MIAVKRKPRWAGVVLRHTHDLRIAEQSKYPYGDCGEHENCYTLTVLGFLHRWTGLTLFVTGW